MFEGSSCQIFLGISTTSVIITVWLWCWPMIHDILLFCTSILRHLTANWGWPACSLYPSYYTCSTICLYTNLQVSVCVFSVEFNFTLTVFDLIFYITAYHWNKLLTVIKKYIAYYSSQFDVKQLIFCWQSFSGIGERDAACPWFRMMSSNGSPTMQCGS